MNVGFTSDQEIFVRKAIDEGRLTRPEDAVAQAMALWEERERRRVEILARVDAAKASIARGESVAITPEAMRALADDIKRRGLARLNAEGVAITDGP